MAAATRDPLVPFAASRALAGRISGARLQVYREMAHGFLFEAPRRLARAVFRLAPRCESWFTSSCALPPDGADRGPPQRDPRADRRRRARADRRRRLREASVAAVAARAGVATGTVYRHFPSKSELFAEVFRRASQREVDAVVAAAAAATGAAADRRAVETFARRALPAAGSPGRCSPSRSTRPSRPSA